MSEFSPFRLEDYVLMSRNSVAAMDWRAMSRSRSRISMDWRPASRSRSRPPEASVAYDQHGLMSNAPFDSRYAFPTMAYSSNEKPDQSYKAPSPAKGIGTSSTASVPKPGTSMLSATRRSPPYTRSELPSVYEDQSEANAPPFDSASESRYFQSLSYNNHPLSASAYPSPSFAPSSLPSFGLHGLTRVPSASTSSSPEQRTFPRHVRKTSFDHTVSKDGILAGLAGRHQVNGKPLSPDSSIGSKRRAETPHVESILRADPSDVDGAAAAAGIPISQQSRQGGDETDFDRGSPFPSSSFNFSFPAFDGLFLDMANVPGAPSSLGTETYNVGNLESRYHQHNLHHQHAHHDSESSINGPGYSSAVGSPASNNVHERLSAHAAAASAVMAEGYAQLSAANLTGVDDSTLDYRQLMGLVYPSLDNGGGSLGSNHPYTHVDPTQILSGVQGGGDGNGAGGPYTTTFHASPSSDGWGNGVSSNASPEPYNTSNASTPPSMENAPNGQQNPRNSGPVGRKYISLKQQDGVHKKKSSLPGAGASPKLGDLRSSTSTPELGEAGKGGSDEGDQTPTLCTNCQTTNTPLWRRDPEGQPLCTSFFFFVDRLALIVHFRQCLRIVL